MKKWIAALAAVLLLVLMLAVGVSADAEKLTETSRNQYANDHGNVIIGFTLPDGADKDTIQVEIGGELCNGVEVFDSSLRVSLAGIPAGVYDTVKYMYEVNGTDEESTVTGTPIVVAGTVDVIVTGAFDGRGYVTVTAVDENGVPVSGYKLTIQSGSMLDNLTTNASGKATARAYVDFGEKAVVQGFETKHATCDWLTYNATGVVSFVRTIPTTTAPSIGNSTSMVDGTTTTVDETMSTTVGAVVTGNPSDVTASTTVPTTPKTTAAIVKGGRTTSIEDEKIVMNAMTDTAVLDAFGLDRQDFLNRARLVLSDADYKKLVGRLDAVPVLSVRSALTDVTPAMVRVAVGKASAFSVYDEQQRKVQSFDLSVVLVDRNGRESALSVVPQDVAFTVRLPIPASMEGSAKYAVMMTDGNALTPPTEVVAKDGMLEFEIREFATYTLVGFGDESNSKAGGVSRVVITLLIAGVVLLAGAGLILYFFVLRKPAAEAVESGVNEQPQPMDSDTEIFSGRTDMDNTWQPEDN